MIVKPFGGESSCRIGFISSPSVKKKATKPKEKEGAVNNRDGLFVLPDH